jgi:NAD(P)-dependent dehydrogenase (short-subunit alcohol dehydrogenase family)
MDSFLNFEPDTTIVVTGAASGIGQALAVVAARQGLRVAAWDLTEEGTHRAVEAIEAVGGVGHAVVADVADATAVARAWAETTEAFGPVTCFAGVAGPPSFLDRPFTEGVAMALDCMRLPTEAWLEQPDTGSRSAVYFSSVQGPRYGAGVPWYTVAKSAIDGYMRSIAAMRPGGIRANALLPDWTLTPRTQEFVDRVGGPGWDANPMGRIGFAEDLANAALFLLSPAAEYINGVSLEVEGGSRLRSLGWMRMAQLSGSAA